MGIFNFMKKRPNSEKVEAEAVQSKENLWPLTLCASTVGTIVPMEQIPDPVFSGGILGQCYGIEPSVGEVYAPVSGKISTLAESLHAVGIEGEGDVQILIHVGIDTVEMNGDGFSSNVKIGDFVKKGQKILTMDLEKIKACGHSSVVITVVTNSSDFESIKCIASGPVLVADQVAEVCK